MEVREFGWVGIGIRAESVNGSRIAQAAVRDTEYVEVLMSRVYMVCTLNEGI